MINDKMVSVPGAPVVGFPGAQGAPLQFGALLKARRRQARLSQKDLADMMHVTRNTVVNWEADKSRPDYAMLPVLCTLLNIRLHELFGIPAENGLSPLEDRVVRHLRALSPAGRRVADRLVSNRTSIRNMKYVMQMGLPMEHDLDEAERNITAKITHQLKTPLAIISSQIELNHEESDPEKREYYYNSIMDEIDKLSLLISEILQSIRGAQQDSGFVICRQPISANVTVLCQKYENWVAASNIRFKSEIEDDVFVECDWIQIEQVLHNYMMNAFKHTKAGKTISLSLRKERDDVYIGVHNEGEWVPAADMERVWKSYYQGAGEQSDTEIGLGLYIVKDIMKKHHGSYGLFNDKTGVEFYLRLPLGTDEADTASGSDAEK